MPFTDGPPTVTAMVLCDNVAKAVTPDGRISLTGLHDLMNFPTFPIPFQFIFFVSLAGVTEAFDMRLKIVRLVPGSIDTEANDFGTPIRIEPPPGPIFGGVTSAYVQSAFIFRGAGRHEVHVYANEGILAYKPFAVNLIQLPGMPGPSPAPGGA